MVKYARKTTKLAKGAMSGPPVTALFFLPWLDPESLELPLLLEPSLLLDPPPELLPDLEPSPDAEIV